MCDTLSFDRQMMQRCLELARLGWGKTAPNPLVGSVIVKEGKIVGEGFHPQAGQPHAEIFALRAAQEQAESATVYVNLEPCNHYGRTPPCTSALIDANVTKVVVGMVDPDPRVSGKGIERLRQAGIEVIVGVEERDCLRLNEAFIHRIRHHYPFGILKYAMTLDGKIATTTGHSAWVTGEASRRLVHHLRGGCQAVIIGGNTVRRDNPHLTTHNVSDNNPLRVVMSRTLDLPLDANLWNTQIAPTMIFCESQSNAEKKKYFQQKGVEVIELERLTPKMVFNELYHRNCWVILWECGGMLAAKAIADGTVQKIMAFIAPKIIGGKNAPSPVGELNLIKMSDALPMTQVSFSQIEQDILIEGYLNGE